MRRLFLGVFLSFSAFAEDCFVRDVELKSSEVSLAKEICVTDINLELELFGNSYALVSFKLDGVAKTLKTHLKYPKRLSNGKVAFRVENMDISSTGGLCDHTESASASGHLIMNADGSDAQIESIEAELIENWDSCHGSDEVVQSFYYIKK